MVNYPYRLPRCRVETHVSINYGSHIEVVRHIIVDTVRQVERSLPDRPVDTLYNHMEIR